MKELKRLLLLHEGISYYPYRDTVGKITIGIGRNIEDNGITHDEALFLLENDIHRCMGELSCFDWFVRLDEVRRGVLIELDFNIGIFRLRTFKKMIAALKIPDYSIAAAELLDSKWAVQVGKNRSNNMANRLLTGEYATQ